MRFCYRSLARIGCIGVLSFVHFSYSSVIGIIGGQGGPTATPYPYAAFVSSDAALTELFGGNFPLEGVIQAVAINSLRRGIIGGQKIIGAGSFGPPYAALVAPNGTLTELSIEDSPSQNTTNRIQSVAINDAGMGIIGGRVNSRIYAALVGLNATVIPLSGGGLSEENGVINSVAINDAGSGIIGGEKDFFNAYAALVAPNGDLTELSGANFPSTAGIIHSVAINRSGTGVIGGQDQNNGAYAELVTPDGTLTEFSGGNFPLGDGSLIRSVAINSSGAGIIGGERFISFGAGPAYIAHFSPDGILTELFGDSLSTVQSDIQSVAINDSGAGIVGGENRSAESERLLYAALVAPDGTFTELFKENPPRQGLIKSVAINAEGVGLIGGEVGFSMPSPYAALVAPNGTLTELSGENFPSSVQGVINSVAMALNDVVPKSYGPGNSYVNSIFPLTSQILPNHIMRHHKKPYHRTQRVPPPETSFLADATNRVRASVPCLEAPTYALWLTGFGTYAREKKEANFAALTNWIGGAMLGFECLDLQNAAIGGGVAYAYNHISYSKEAGRSRFHQEFFTLYGSWNTKHLFISGALWGGLYQLSNKRAFLETMSSRSNVNGWLLIPHFELGTPFHPMGDWFVVEPFIMVDWANNWQGKVEEHGASGLNLRLGSTYTSLLRTEAGFRFFESIHYRWGDWILEQKASYVNKLPFHTADQATAFVASISSFSIAVFSNRTQNLGVIQLSSHFIPCSKKYPYGALNYQGEFGSSFQSHLVSIEIGKYF